MTQTTHDPALLHGTLDLLVLKALAWGPTHGYGVVRWIREASGETILIEDRALYLALHRLEERELLASEWGASENGRRARFYSLTTEGRRELKTKTRGWQRWVESVGRLLDVPRAEGAR